jgi:hypothetical protein
MDARLFLATARTLASTNPADATAAAAYRTAVSRSYYAAFNVAVGFLEGIGLEVIDKPSGHSWVKNSFIYVPDPAVKRIGMALETLHRERKYADYDMQDLKPERQKTASGVVRQAEQVISDLDGYRLSPTNAAALEAAIKNWVRTTPHCGLQII